MMSRVRKAEEFGVSDNKPPPISGHPAEPKDLSAAVSAAQDGDPEAFQSVFRALQPGLLRYLYVLVGSEAEDVASETWLHVVRDLDTFRGDADGFRGWLVTVGRNRALDHLRRQRRRPQAAGVPMDYLADLPAVDDTTRAALGGFRTGTALGLIATLPRDQAEAVLLRVVMDLDADSAARVLGKRSGAVRMAAQRGLRKLAKLLEQPETGPGQAGTTGRGEPAGEAGQKSSPEGVTRTNDSTLKDLR
jgi:RNA polymerase sigma-70 factor (ECF subfamily)